MGAPDMIVNGTAAGGPPIGGIGTPNTIPRWTGPSTLGDSGLTDDGSVITSSRNFISQRTGGSVANTEFLRLRNLTVADQSNVTIGLYVANNNVATGTISHLYNSVGATYDTTFSLWNGSALAEVMRIKQGGNVGIGTASPGYKFVVADTVAGVVTSEVRNDSTNSAATARLQLNTQGGTSWIEAFRNAGGALSFATLSTERARIDSAGRLLVGTSTSPNLASEFVTAQGSSSSYLGTWKTAATAGGMLIGSGGEPVEIYRSSGASVDAQTFTRVLCIDVNNNVFLDTARTGATIQAAGSQQGLKLPATPGNADAQTLDCYQENPLATTAGNGWTPTIGGTAAQWGGTLPTVSYARYIRIGSMVFCEARLTGAALISQYGVTTISAPPVTENAYAYEAAVSVSTSNGGNSGVGAQSSGTVYLPTLTATTVMRLTWFYFA